MFWNSAAVFETSGQRTKAFLDQLAEMDLLMDGEIAITRNDMPDKAICLSRLPHGE